MKIDTLGGLVDLQPVFEAGVALSGELTPPETKAFIEFKLRQEAKHLRTTARWIERRLNELQPKPRKKR